MTSPMENDKLYEEIGRNWLHYVSWREKIFAGYLSVLAALAFAFSKESGIPVRTALCGFAVVVSVVFWILDFRTTELVNLCQLAGEKMAESKGFYGALNQRRFAERHLVSFGLAINLLVSSIIATSAVGVLISIVKWKRSADEPSIWWALVAVALTAVVFGVLYSYADNKWSDERERHNKLLSKNVAGGQNKNNPS